MPEENHVEQEKQDEIIPETPVAETPETPEPPTEVAELTPKPRPDSIGETESRGVLTESVVEMDPNEIEVTDPEEVIPEDGPGVVDPDPEPAPIAEVEEAASIDYQARIDAYVRGGRSNDDVVQRNKGGLFVSTRTRTVYVPVTIFK